MKDEWQDHQHRFHRRVAAFAWHGSVQRLQVAILVLTQVLARELGRANIQVNAIAPGVIKTHFSEALWQTPQIAEPILGRTPLGCFGEPEDVAGLALYLASPDSNFVTGGVFVVDGSLNVAPVMG